MAHTFPTAQGSISHSAVRVPATTAGSGDLLRAVWRALTLLPEGKRRMREADRLFALSDAALAARGLRREDIIRSVFLDSRYL